MALLILLFLFQAKHFICDFPLQAFPYQYENKGNYGHLGGVVHALIHAIGTFIVLYYFAKHAFTLAILDGLIHYHIDWLKMNINKAYNLKPDNSQWFWILLGIDQLLHQLTYLLIIILIL